MRILVNVLVVIEVDKIVTNGRAKNDPDDRSEKNADRNDPSAIRLRATLRWNRRHR